MRRLRHREDFDEKILILKTLHKTVHMPHNRETKAKRTEPTSLKMRNKANKEKAEVIYFANAFLEGSAGKSTGTFKCRTVVSRSPTGAEDVDVV